MHGGPSGVAELKLGHLPIRQRYMAIQPMVEHKNSDRKRPVLEDMSN